MNNNQKKDKIFNRALEGKVLNFNDPEFREIEKIQRYTNSLVIQFNQEPDELKRRKILSEILNYDVPEGTEVSQPLNTDFGGHIFLGNHVFVNADCMFVDLGGIYLEDHVLIGPRVTLISVNHVKDPEQRRNIVPKSVHIKKNAWVGAGSIILPGVTVGENAIVGAGSIVTKNVPDNDLVVGNPANSINN